MLLKNPDAFNSSCPLGALKIQSFGIDADIILDDIRERNRETQTKSDSSSVVASICYFSDQNTTL